MTFMITYELGRTDDKTSYDQNRSDVFSSIYHFAPQGHSTNFVNELKLSDFKLVLTRNGEQSW